MSDLHLWMQAWSDLGERVLTRVESAEKIDRDTLAVDCTKEEFRALETALYQVLHRTTANEPLKMVQQVEGQRGFEAWHTKPQVQLPAAISVTVHLLANMETDEVKSDTSLKFDEFNNEVEMYDIVDRSMAEEKNLGPNTFPLTRSYALKLGDIIEAVNMQRNIDEIQRELRTALSVKLRVSRSGNLDTCGAPAERETEEPRV